MKHGHKVPRFPVLVVVWSRQTGFSRNPDRTSCNPEKPQVLVPQLADQPVAEVCLRVWAAKRAIYKFGVFGVKAHYIVYVATVLSIECMAGWSGKADV